MTRSSRLKEKQQRPVPLPVGLTIIRKNSGRNAVMISFKKAKLQLLMAEAEEHGLQQTINSKTKRLKEVKHQLTLGVKDLFQANHWQESIEFAQMPMQLRKNWMTGLLFGYLIYQAGKHIPQTITRIREELNQEASNLQTENYP